MGRTIGLTDLPRPSDLVGWHGGNRECRRHIRYRFRKAFKWREHNEHQLRNNIEEGGHYKSTRERFLSLRSLLGLLKQVMRDPPRVASVKREQFRASHVEDLPPAIPRVCILLAVSLLEMRPQLLTVLYHGCEPVLVKDQSSHTCDISPGCSTHLAGLGVMVPIYPPLLLDF